jgi:type VI secretion system protein
MHEERLLEKIRIAEQDPVRLRGNSSRRCADSVMKHLQQLLNTRQGSVPMAEDYGIPDFFGLLQTHPESINEIENNIKNAITTYEPRLSGIAVHYIPDEDESTLTLSFQVTARLVTDDDQDIFFRTVVDTDGRIHLK